MSIPHRNRRHIKVLRWMERPTGRVIQRATEPKSTPQPEPQLQPEANPKAKSNPKSKSGRAQVQAPDRARARGPPGPAGTRHRRGPDDRACRPDVPRNVPREDPRVAAGPRRRDPHRRDARQARTALGGTARPRRDFPDRQRGSAGRLAHRNRSDRRAPAHRGVGRPAGPARRRPEPDPTRGRCRGPSPRGARSPLRGRPPAPRERRTRARAGRFPGRRHAQHVGAGGGLPDRPVPRPTDADPRSHLAYLSRPPSRSWHSRPRRRRSPAMVRRRRWSSTHGPRS